MSETTFTYPADEPIMVITRVFQAPRELVWQACTRPEHMARWWGPRKYTNDVLEMDVRPGGAWRIDQKAESGQVYRFFGTFLELVEPEKLVLTFNFEGNPGDEVIESHTFESVEGGTRLSTVSRFARIEDRNGMRDAGMEGGARESYERLDELLADLQGGGAVARTTDREMIITRVYDAPRELVFDAWTDPDHLSEWWGPNGFRTTVHAQDLRPGGSSRYTMHGPDGTDYPNLQQYEEVAPPSRLVYAHGSPEEPGMFLVTVTFDDEGGKTRITLRSLFPSAEALQAVMKYGAIEGGQNTLDRFAAHLATSAVAASS
jgi:uncharacterized protein YndB with AHSA1/START domain